MLFFFFYKFKFFSDLIKLIKTDEVINWRNLIEHFEQDLKVGDSSYPATDAFKSDEGAKRWNDFKTRIVEHVKNVFLFKINIIVIIGNIDILRI